MAEPFGLTILTRGEPRQSVDATLTKLAPVIGAAEVDIEHEGGCPTIDAEGEAALDYCTCDRVCLVITREPQ